MPEVENAGMAWDGPGGQKKSGNCFREIGFPGLQGILDSFSIRADAVSAHEPCRRGEGGICRTGGKAPHVFQD